MSNALADNDTPSRLAASTTPHAVVPHARWVEARRALLAREKALQRQSDQLARERQALPWERVEKVYVFETAAGPRRLGELFDGRSQLIVQHVMFAPGDDEACKHCAFMSDHVDPMLPHLARRDTAFIAIARAPVAALERFGQRMGWRFRWASSGGNDFNHDYGVSFTRAELARGHVTYNYGEVAFPHQDAPGISVFARAVDGTVFHTYSTYFRGVERMMLTYQFLDIVPKGRDEAETGPMGWVRLHDEYAPADGASAHACCGG
ncbi:MAG: DUF899 domain-containing protein [Burkholderiaceae bacterium]